MEVKRKNWIKVLSCFLAALMVIQILPLSVFANDVQNNSSQEVQSPYEDLSIKEEIVEERDAYSKTYLLENGVYCTLTSSTEMHTEVDGKWEETNPLDSIPETIDEASIELTSQTDTTSDQQTTPNLNDGLVVKDNNSNLTIYGAEIIEDENGDYGWNITTGSGKINEMSYVLIKPTIANANISYNKTEVTVNASIKLTCNTQLSSDSYDTYVQAFNNGWTDDSFNPNELLELGTEGLLNLDNQIYDYNTIDEAGNYVWNITSLYSKWENGTKTNNGLAIHADGTENIYITSGILIRYYRVIDENDSGFTYHYEDMGRAGTFCVNDYTNVPILQRNEFSIDGKKMPVSLNRYITNGLDNDSFGTGGRWNYDSELTYSNNTFIWNTIDGSSKRFQKSSTNETDEDGREKWVEYLYNGGECVLWVKPSSLINLPYDFSQNIIVDEEENIYRFNSMNKLISITSKDNDSINIKYSNGNKISDITDGAGRKYVFDNTGFTAPYNTVKSISIVDANGSAITYDDKNPIDIEYTYVIKNNKVCLSSATYPDGKTVYYDYDDFGRLTTIKNIDNSKLEIKYYNSDASKNPNPIYFSRVESYTKSLYDPVKETYSDENQVKVVFDADETYRRTIKTADKTADKTKEDGKLTIETNQYNTNLDLLYLTDSDGNEYYADYDNSHTLRSFTNSKDSYENLLLNGNMNSTKPGGGPKNWNFINLTPKTCPMIGRDAGLCVQYIDSVDQERGLYQYVSVDGKSGDKYIISAWGKASAIIPRETRFWGVKIYAQNENGDDEIIHEMAFDTSLWDIEQIRKTAFALPFDTKKLRVELLSDRQINTVQFDDIELYKAEDSYVASVDDKDDATSTCPCSNCTEPNCPCKCQNENDCNCIPCKRGITVSYDENGNEITTETDGVNSMISKNGFSSSRNYLAWSEDENSTTTYYTYDENNGVLKSIADGNEEDSVDYTYNAVGLLDTVSQTVTNIITGEEVNMLSSYTYNGDTLTKIDHNGSSYSFEYDVYGNVSNVKIENQSLAEYSYNNSEQLGYLLYGNGDRINYTYNSDGKITSISTQCHDEENDNVFEYEYKYNDNGELSSYIDNANGTKTNYTNNGYSIIIPAADENSEDTVIYSTVDSADTNESSVNLFGYEFNTKQNQNKYDIETGQTTASSEYTLPYDILDVKGAFESLTVTDYFGRNISSTVKMHYTDLPADAEENADRYYFTVNNSYTYKNLNGNQRTNLVESFTSSTTLNYVLSDEEAAEIYESLENGAITQEEADELLEDKCSTLKSITTSYEYDNAGRIKKIYRDNEIIASYSYDEAGQLTEEASYNPLSIVRYTYDKGGDITSKVYYENAELDEENKIIYGDPTDTINYSYNGIDGVKWGDLLTKYNGLDINYDKMGNPLNYHGTNYYGQEHDYELKWNGRLLTEVTFNDEYGDPSEKYIYSYNADGLRTKKERYLWNKQTNDYNLYQIGEYIWEDNIIKGYRIKYENIGNQENFDSPYIILVPLYNDSQEIMGVSYKSHGWNANSSHSDIADYESLLYFTKDAQGNVISVIDTFNRYEIVYQYDTYGKAHITIPNEEERINKMPETTFAQQLEKRLAYVNLVGLYSVYKEIIPFFYRGYFYDGETGLYYNQSRYYSGEWGRFINADNPMLIDTGTGTTNSNNVFAYCENDPVNNIDPDGTFYKVIGKAVKRNNYFKIPLTDWISTSGNPTITWTRSKSVSASVSGNISGTIHGIGLSIGATSSFTLTASSSYQWKVSSKKGKKARIVAQVDAYQYYIKQTRGGYSLVMKKIGKLYLCSFVYRIKNSYGYYYAPIKNSQLISIEYR